MAPPPPEEEEEKDRILVAGRPHFNHCDNMITTSKYTLSTFLPLAISEQFRRFANLYFLVVGCIMAIGLYTELFETAVPPGTTLGPLAVVVAISLAVEGSADVKRHKNDEETNHAPCVVLRRAEEIDAEEEENEREPSVLHGQDVAVSLNKAYYNSSVGDQPETPVASKGITVKVAYQHIKRMDIRQGHIVLVRNREMVPADVILLASSNDGGSAYIETSSIDGETNLKLRNSPQLPAKILRHLRDGVSLDAIEEEEEYEEDEEPGEIESLEQATKRVTRFSALAHPDGQNVLNHPTYLADNNAERVDDDAGAEASMFRFSSIRLRASSKAPDSSYVAALTSEPPNPHVNTYSGKLTLPPFGNSDECHDIALGADNVLLRGAVLRNTEWVIGLSVFTGTDTKLVRNSFDTPSKFSQLDVLMNNTVLAILVIMFLSICYLSTMAVSSNADQFDQLWYTGLSTNTELKWPYLPDLDAPKWSTSTNNWLQYFFLNITLLNNFVPLSLYVTVEIITYIMIWLVNVDQEMYDDCTNTRAVARSTNITDLGRIQYIFSDKTGTLTQNVMRFKRCSVDGLMFGAPIAKTRPGADSDQPAPSSFHPLHQLLVGNVSVSSGGGLEGLGGASSSIEIQQDKNLTFNAEMFLRVLSLCHTVVVEKDLDHKEEVEGSKVQGSTDLSMLDQIKKLFGMKPTEGKQKGKTKGKPSPPVALDQQLQNIDQGNIDASAAPYMITERTAGSKSADGAPLGFAYQAESPDEGALVSAASRTFGFQVVARDSSGIRLRVTSPSILQDPKIVEGLKNGTKSLTSLALETCTGDVYTGEGGAEIAGGEGKTEIWTILAVNKFDSTRKRMSILLRAPAHLGSVPILFCKGADTAMLDPEVATGLQGSGEDGAILEVDEDASADESDFDFAQIYGLQAHLGDFASEGLRTLVLGIRVLSEKQCQEWLDEYKAAATSIKNRDELLTKAAQNIERNIYIVGATAIEDKLQTSVPKTISTLEAAGIKLWVLTGDKRETAVEIGYATHVLTPKMHVTEVPDNGEQHVRTQIAMEFIRLVKKGKLPLYQRSAVDGDAGGGMEKFLFSLGKVNRSFSRSFWRCFFALWKLCFPTSPWASSSLKSLDIEEAADEELLQPQERRRKVRDFADKVIQEYLNSPEGLKRRRRGGHEDEQTSLATDEPPSVFARAQSARDMLSSVRSMGGLKSSEIRSLRLAQLTASQIGGDNDQPGLVDEDTLSLDSFFPGDKASSKSDFDRRKRTLLERLFAVDRDVRKGQLTKHLHQEKLEEVLAYKKTEETTTVSESGPRGFVIEGAALKHLLGHPQLEEVLFSVASQCEAVIACRVSPKQKALLVNLVRDNVRPEPITLAIGDGANDVGMIQEAHVGVGISGKEGKQAVNASDFAIAQFRFLEELVLIHGRWNFFRLSTVVLFSFYKNAIMAGILIVFTAENVYSGTPLFDEWMISMLNFVAGAPILLLGLFDRCLSKEYVKANPEVFKATRNNELMTARSLLRWIILCVLHVATLFYFTVPQQAFGGGMTPAFDGLMRNEDPDVPGNGEGGDLKSMGTVTFTCMVILLAYKVLYESKALIHGVWPAFTCREGVGEGFLSRIAYTWHGFIFTSLAFYFVFIAIYGTLGRSGASTFSDFVDISNHVLGTRSLSWVLILFVPIFGTTFDVTGKTFSNMFYPTQTQVHMELEAREKYNRKRYMRERQAQNPDEV